MQRAQHRQWVLKPQDLVVALKLHLLGADFRSYAHLASSLHLSAFEAHAAVQRLLAAHLAVEIDGRIRPIVASLRSFLIRGAPFAYPAVRGGVTIGTPTAHAVAPLLGATPVADELPPVWPNPDGTVRGQALLPLYPGAARAALDDPNLHELLALFDALRSGQARERELAGRLLEERLA
jgi:hypothetical protein